MLQKMLRLDASFLQRLSKDILTKLGMREEDARDAAEVFVRTSLRGTDSHGIRLLPTYARRIEEGGIKAKPEVKILKESDSAALWDGDHGLGQLLSRRAMEEAIGKSKRVGIGLVTIRHGNHFGAAGYYALLAAEADCAGLATSNTIAAMAIYGGKERAVGNNPLALGVPAGKHPPLILDMATSVVSWGQVRNYLLAGKNIPVGWALSKTGEPTDNPEVALDRGVVLPSGGPKGSGMAILIDCLSGILSGGASRKEVGSIFADFSQPEDSSQTFLAINIDFFVPIDEFKARVDKLAEELKRTTPAEGVKEIRLPGERRAEEEKLRRRLGIPLDPETITALKEWAEKLGIGTPF